VNFKEGFPAQAENLLREEKASGVIIGALGSLVHLVLDGQGVFKFFHSDFQIGEALLLLSQEEVFDPIKPFHDLRIKCLDLLVQCLHVLFAGHGAPNHLGQAFNDGDVFVHRALIAHIIKSIT
jgi:hypothetical protein